MVTLNFVCIRGEGLMAPASRDGVRFLSELDQVLNSLNSQSISNCLSSFAMEFRNILVQFDIMRYHKSLVLRHRHGDSLPVLVHDNMAEQSERERGRYGCVWCLVPDIVNLSLLYVVILGDNAWSPQNALSDKNR